VTVRWPSGAKTVARDVPADRIVTLREGDAAPTATAAR
jgi:hypothetical protein